MPGGARPPNFPLICWIGRRRPADEARNEGHAEIGMLRPNAEGEAVQAAPSAWGICLKQIIAPAVFSDRAHRCRNSIDKTAGRVETAEVKLDCNILWRDQTKLDPCTHPNFGSNRQGWRRELVRRPRCECFAIPAGGERSRRRVPWRDLRHPSRGRDIARAPSNRSGRHSLLPCGEC